ncbi:MAG TPA: chlorite dismutase family protein [bacterium]|nr:chlorite dismutase family protein [bacterium]
MPEPMKRQFVSFGFYRISEEFRKLAKSDRDRVKASFIQAAEEFRKEGILLSYSTVGFKAGVDLMLWRISYDLDSIQRMDSRLFHSAMGPYLTQAANYLSMTKRSIYIDKHQHVGGTEESRTNILPGKFKYIFVYPFVKTREWYLLSKEDRQKVMDEHIRVGNLYPSVKLNTTYSFGLDDQDFVVAFETDVPGDFLDLVMALRETEGSKYTVRDTPIYTCKLMELPPALDLLG